MIDLLIEKEGLLCSVGLLCSTQRQQGIYGSYTGINAPREFSLPESD